MEEARRDDELPVRAGETEGVRHPTRDVADPEAVLDPRVVRAGEDEVREAELPDRVQPLELEGLHEGEDEGVEAEGPVDRVRDRLRSRHARETPGGG